MSGGVDSGGSFWAGCDFEGFAADTQQHAPENDVMQWLDPVKVEQPQQAAGQEEGTLVQRAFAAAARLNTELDQCFAG
jgi:hypothetical protein